MSEHHDPARKQTKPLLFIVAGALLIILIAGSILGLVLQSKASLPVHQGMTANQVTTQLGQPDRVLQAHEVDRPTPGAAEFWYYKLPLRQQDFDSHYLVVAIDPHGVVLEVMDYSN